MSTNLIAKPETPGSGRSRAEVMTRGSMESAYAELEASVGAALETYSNVHRGAGFNSMASTLLYERARDTLLEACGLTRDRHTVIFCSPARAARLEAAARPSRPVVLSSGDLGLPLGLRAVIARTRALPGGIPFQKGGGTVRLVSRRSVVWESVPDRFEAGTPSVINAVALARALKVARRRGVNAFRTDSGATVTPAEVLHSDEFSGLAGRDLLRRLKRTTMGCGRPVPVSGGSLPYVHLDNAASTPAFRAVWDAARRAWRLPEGRRAVLVASVRDLCAGFFGAPAGRYDVIFASNTTEAINLAAEGLGREGNALGDRGVESVVLTTAAEHNSNDLPWRFAEGVALVRTPVDDEGFPDLEEMERLLREYNEDRTHGEKRIRIVAVTGASNVLGACPDLGALARLAHRYRALLFVDAAQLAGHRGIRMEVDGIDALAFSGHKMYAPFGTGGLILRKGLWAAGDEALKIARESGDENIAGIAALGKAIDLLGRVGMDIVQEDELDLTRTALRGLASVPGVRLYGIANPDSPRIARRLGVISFALRGIPHNLAARELSETAGLGVRSGCHCAHILVKRLLRIHPVREAVAAFGSRVAPQLTSSVLPGLVRISFGLENEETDVRRLVLALAGILARRPSLFARLLAKTRNAMPVLPATGTGRRMQAAAEARASSILDIAPAGLADDRPRRAPRIGRISPRATAFLGQPCCRKL